MVPARLTVVTLGVRDLEGMRAFYAGLGWVAAVELEDFAAFHTRGAVLALYPLDRLAADARAEPAAPRSGLRGFTLAINVERRDEVDRTLRAARDAGARVARDPSDEEWGGRSAYFADPEDNFWEVVWVPPGSAVAAAVSRALGGEPAAQGELDSLSTSELYRRARAHALRHLDVAFLWRLLASLPVAEAAAGDLDEARADVTSVVARLDDLHDAAEGPTAEALRPLYLDYLQRHRRGAAG